MTKKDEPRKDGEMFFYIEQAQADPNKFARLCKIIAELKELDSLDELPLFTWEQFGKACQAT
jgi:hypothetical protein